MCRGVNKFIDLEPLDWRGVWVLLRKNCNWGIFFNFFLILSIPRLIFFVPQHFSPFTYHLFFINIFSAPHLDVCSMRGIVFILFTATSPGHIAVSYFCESLNHYLLSEWTNEFIQQLPNAYCEPKLIPSEYKDIDNKPLHLLSLDFVLI